MIRLEPLRRPVEAEISAINNLTADHLKRSVKELQRYWPGRTSYLSQEVSVLTSQMVWCLLFLRNEAISVEPMKLLNERDGLVAGICNGRRHQSSSDCCHGDRRRRKCPTLTFTNIGRHRSKLAELRCSTRSPWLRKASVGQISIKAIHEEGRFVNTNDIDTMLENGQILTQ